MTTFFDVIAAEHPGPILVEVPHAGLEIDDAARRFTRLPEKAIAAQAVLSDSDIGAELVWAGSEVHGVTRIVARASRYVIDLNTEPRLPTPYEEKMPTALRASTVISQCGERWSEDPLPKEELERRVRDVFEPYHTAIERELGRARERHGVALLLSSHTFPGRQRVADVVLGTREGASARLEVRDAIADVFRASGCSVALESPFRGGFSTVRHAHPADGIDVVQIEIARALVCDGEGARSYDVNPRAIAEVAKILVEVASVARRSIER